MYGDSAADEGVTVNLVNGNLVVPLPGPSFSAAGDTTLAVSYTYNSKSTANIGLGQGITSSVDDDFNGVPPQLIDHSLVTGDGANLLEVVDGTGAQQFFVPVGDKLQYRSTDNTSTASISRSGTEFLMTRTEPGGV